MKKIFMLTGMLLGVTICMAQQKPAQTKKTPPKVDITRFTSPKAKKDSAKTQKPKFKPPVIRKDS